jgi:gluconokinase
VFLPYLLGERAPHWNADARAAWLGLTIQHGREHLIRAAFEGITLALQSVAEIVDSVSGPSTEIRATGGLAASPLWSQMLADVFQKRVTVATGVQGTARGAALMGMKALGIIGSLDAAPGLVGETVGYEPRPQAAETYKRLATSFAKLYRATQKELDVSPPART